MPYEHGPDAMAASIRQQTKVLSSNLSVTGLAGFERRQQIDMHAANDWALQQGLRGGWNEGTMNELQQEGSAQVQFHMPVRDS